MRAEAELREIRASLRMVPRGDPNLEGLLRRSLEIKRERLRRLHGARPGE